MNKTGLKATQQRGKNKPTWGHFPLEYLRKTPSLVKKKETKGVCCLRKIKSTINEDSEWRNLSRMSLLGVYESFKL